MDVAGKAGTVITETSKPIVMEGTHGARGCLRSTVQAVRYGLYGTTFFSSAVMVYALAKGNYFFAAVAAPAAAGSGVVGSAAHGIHYSWRHAHDFVREEARDAVAGGGAGLAVGVLEDIVRERGHVHLGNLVHTAEKEAGRGAKAGLVVGGIKVVGKGMLQGVKPYGIAGVAGALFGLGLSYLS